LILFLIFGIPLYLSETSHKDRIRVHALVTLISWILGILKVNIHLRISSMCVCKLSIMCFNRSYKPWKLII